MAVSYVCSIAGFILIRFEVVMGIKIPGIQFQYQNRKIHWINTNNRTPNSQTKQIEQKENERMKVEQHMNNKTGNEHVNKGWVVTVHYLQGLNIFVSTELTIATLFS
jgi:hypothetical protein